MPIIGVMDVCSSVDPVRRAGSLKAAATRRTPEFRAFMTALRHPTDCGFVLHTGPHILTKIYNVLVGPEHWSVDDARTWVRMCEQLVIGTGGRADHETPILPIRQLTKLGLEWGVDVSGFDDDDVNVVRIVRAAHASALVTSEGKFRIVDDTAYDIWNLSEFSDEVFASRERAYRRVTQQQ